MNANDEVDAQAAVESLRIPCASARRLFSVTPAIPRDLLSLEIPASVTPLLDSLAAWPESQWRLALGSACSEAHRARRATSRAVCDAVLQLERRMLEDWLTRDAVRTLVASSAPRLSRRGTTQAIEMVEDAALAMLARPGLPLVDLAVLLGPCLPLREPVAPYAAQRGSGDTR